MSVNVYGMSGCTTVKRAQDWLAENKLRTTMPTITNSTIWRALDMLIDASSLTKF